MGNDAKRTISDKEKELYYHSEIFQVFHGIAHSSRASIPFFPWYFLSQNYKKDEKRDKILNYGHGHTLLYLHIIIQS